MTDERNEFMSRARENLDVINANMAEVEARISRTSGEARREFKKGLEKMRHAKNEAERKLEDVRLAAQPAWQDLKQGAEEARKAFADAVERAGERLQ